MKNTSQCPKCDGRKTIRIPSPKFGRTGDNSIRIGWGKSNQSRVTRYLCCQCGFTEEWVDDPYDIAKIEASYDNHELDEFV